MTGTKPTVPNPDPIPRRPGRPGGRTVRGMADAWETIGSLVTWLDENSPLAPDADRLLRIMKIGEEVGETNQAVIGVLGQNPRKGVTHTWEDVHAELSDVILTAMVALSTLTPDAAKVFQSHLDRVAERSLGSRYAGRDRQQHIPDLASGAGS
jgi:hypothetical protein